MITLLKRCRSWLGALPGHWRAFVAAHLLAPVSHERPAIWRVKYEHVDGTRYAVQILRNGARFGHGVAPTLQQALQHARRDKRWALRAYRWERYA